MWEDRSYDKGLSHDKRSSNEGNQVPPSGSNSYAPKKKNFYALHSPCYQESSPDVMKRMLQVFFIELYAL